MIGGLGEIFQHAKEFRTEMVKAQEALARKEVEATSGGGMVTVKANGEGKIISIKVDPEIVEAKDVEMLEDLILAGVNEALRKAGEMTREEIGKLTGGLNPDLLRLFSPPGKL